MRTLPEIMYVKEVAPSHFIYRDWNLLNISNSLVTYFYIVPIFYTIVFDRPMLFFFFFGYKMTRGELHLVL